jgi:hypothetical protein
MPPSRYISICPILAINAESHWLNSSLPVKIADSLFFADVSEIIRETTFASLTPLLLSKSEADGLKHLRYALVRHFECRDAERPFEEEESANLLYRLYLGLKVIRPSSGRFQVFHYEMSQTPPRLPRGSRNDYATILCDSCECLNRMRHEDLQELVTLAPSILSVFQKGALPVSQATQSLEIGYRADFLNVRHLLWVVGLDALFTSTEWENQGAKLSAKRITNFLGSDFQIYSGEHFTDLGLPAPTNPPLNKTLRDIYRLRNHFAHGAWPDRQWAGKVWRRSADSCRDIHYSELLSEAASSILRGCLRKILSDKQSVEMFNDKAEINAHFAQLGLVRKKKAKCITPR